MKKIFAILLIVGFGGFLMNSCQKNDVQPTNDQVVVSNEFHELGCNLLPADDYAKIPVA